MRYGFTKSVSCGISHGYLTDISRISHRYLTDISRISHGYLTDISRISHGYLTDISRISHGYLTDISRIYLTDISRISHGYLTDISRISHGYLTGISRISHGYLTEYLNGVQVSSHGLFSSRDLYVYTYVTGFLCDRGHDQSSGDSKIALHFVAANTWCPPCSVGGACCNWS